MKTYLLQKVPFKLPGKKRRLIWAAVVGQRDGLSLLFIRKADSNWSDTLVVAVENVQERCFEQADRFVFPVEKGDLSDIGGKLQALDDRNGPHNSDQWVS
jgi:hypothetical protein